MMGWVAPVIFLLYGLLFGSFANVVIWRIPRGESIVSPGSHCPGCDAPIAWYDNVPLVSWVSLGGRCRHCGERISVRYPVVEALSGGLFLTAALMWDTIPQALAAAVLFWLLLVLAAVDLDCYRLPNPLVGTLALVGLAGAAIAQFTGIPLVPLVRLPAGGLFASPLAFAAAGSVLGSGMSAGVAALYGAVRKRRGLGMGDVKLLGALGLYLGPYVLLALFFGSVFGMVVGLAASRESTLREARIPFGPSLAAGSVVAAVVGPAAWTWYLALVGLA